MSTTLTNGVIIPENGSRNWGGDLANNWNILDLNVGYMTDVKNRVTTLENSTAENTANIQINASNISALQTSKQDAIEDLETIRDGASAGATAVQPSTLNNYVDLSSNQTITGAKTFSGDLLSSGSNNLGTSTNKWKTLNGINPGALSLPSTTGLINIASSITALDGNTISKFTPQVDGWLLINGIGIVNEGFIYAVQGRIGASSTTNSVCYRCAILLPIVAGVEVSVTCKLNTLTWANIVPNQGNV